MKIRILLISLFVIGLFAVNQVNAQSEERNVSSFSEISLRVPGKLSLEQGQKQSVEIVAKTSTLEEIITEVKDRKLIIRFKSKNYFRTFNPGKIEIFVTVPEIDGLGISGSGDIIAEDKIKTRILDLAVSGSGNIKLDDLSAERVKANISGSGDIIINDGGIADDLSVSISGSGNVKAGGFEVKDVAITIAGSGNCTVLSNGSLKARIAGSGNVYYNGNPAIDTSVAGSGSVKKL